MSILTSADVLELKRASLLLFFCGTTYLKIHDTTRHTNEQTHSGAQPEHRNSLAFPKSFKGI